MKRLSRPVMAGIALVVGILFLTLLSFVLPKISEGAATIVLDRYSKIFRYPFTIQNLTWLLFFLGLGELILRYRDASTEITYSRKRYLPEDDRTVLQSHDLGGIRQKVIPELNAERAFLPNMINRCILQFLSSESVSETNSILNSLGEVYFHQIELKYSILRYLSWVIPVIGFIGTVIGIAASLHVIGDGSGNPELGDITASLGVAFYTTLVALALSAVLVFCIHIVQEREERSLNRSLEYCLANLINRLYTSK